MYEYGNQKIYNQIFQRIKEIDRSMSAKPGILQNTDSNLMQINQNAGIAPVKIEPDLLKVLERAEYFAEISNGAFDPTIGSLVNLWGIGTENQRIPETHEIAQALSLVNWKDLIVDQNAETAFLQKPGMALDLGAIAKGYAADEAARICREANIPRAIIDLGGNIIALGSRDNKNNPWRIGIQDPLKERGSYIGVIQLIDKTAVTSGVYERFFEKDEKKYHHILSTENGCPVDNGILSVTIISENSMDADGLSTSVFVLGFEKGLALLKKFHGAEAIFIFNDHHVFVTDGIKNLFRLTSDKYTLID